MIRGRCACGAVIFHLTSEPLYVHCCHCRWCQRETGSAFVVHAVIETDRVELEAGHPEMTEIPTDSGMGQTVARCPDCRIGLWSIYTAAGKEVSFVKVGTLEDPDALPPKVHMLTKYKQPWIVLSPDTPALPEFYSRKDHWPAESLARWSHPWW
jgi:hypothetical protein